MTVGQFAGSVALLVCVLNQGRAEELPKVDFRRDVQPLFKTHCIDCHGPVLQMAELRLDQRRFVRGADANPDLVRVGQSAESLLIKRMCDSKLGLIMPPTFPFFPGEKRGLPEAQINTFKAWIDEGAEWPEEINLAADATGSETEALKALLSAVRAGNQAAVATLLGKDKSIVNGRDKYDETPLMHAAVFAELGIVKLLLDAGADVNAASREGATPLMRAAGNYEKSKLLIERGAKIDARSNLGRTALLIAAAYPGNLPTVRLLLERGSNVDDKDQVGETCLTSAAKRGDAEMVKFLLEKGADLNAVSFLGRAAVAWAAEEGNLETLKLLLDAGAAENQQQLHMALFNAAGRENTSAVRLLMQCGGDPNAVSPLAGYTPLMWAAASENVDAEVVRMMLEKGGDANIKAATGDTPISLAKRRGQTEVAKLLDPKADAPISKTAAIPSPRADAAQIKAAIEKSLPLLQSCGPTFFTRAGCVACHQQAVTSLAVAEAGKHGIKVDEETEREQVHITAVIGKTYRERYLQRADNPAGSPSGIGYMALGLAAAGFAGDDGTDAMIVELAGRQQLDGSWTAFSHRPPLEYSRIANGALAIRSMQLYAPPGLKSSIEGHIRRAARWLASAKPNNTTDHIFRLLGLAWAGGFGEEVKAEIQSLLNAQNEDGGWSQFSTLASDAYVSGQALWALHLAGIEPSHAAYQRGVDYLVHIQLPDGSWHVKTRVFPFQPYFESGFPHGPDQWISATATGFAAVTLMQALPSLK
jgi:ankyrin repeat protein